MTKLLDELLWRVDTLKSMMLSYTLRILHSLIDGGCMVVPEKLRASLLEETHAGKFSGHLVDKKVYVAMSRGEA